MASSEVNRPLTLSTLFVCLLIKKGKIQIWTNMPVKIRLQFVFRSVFFAQLPNYNLQCQRCARA